MPTPTLVDRIHDLAAKCAQMDALNSQKNSVHLDATDADVLTAMGVYYCTNCTVALHYPSTHNFFVEVIKNGSNIIQIASDETDTLEYRRVSSDKGSTWNAWFSLDSTLVHKTGNETVAGVKTFSNIPVIPTTVPSADGQVASKKYVDDGLAEKVTIIDGDIYVDANASAGGDGLTPETAFQKIGDAISALRFYQPLTMRTSGYGPSYNIHVAAGEYTENVLVYNGLKLYFRLGASGVIINGNFTVSECSLAGFYDGALTINGALSATYWGRLYCNANITANSLSATQYGMIDIAKTANISSSVSSTHHSFVNISSTGSLTCGSNITVRYNSILIGNGDITINGNAAFIVFDNSHVSIAKTLTIGPVNNISAVINVQNCSSIRADSSSSKFVINGSVKAGASYGAINIILNSVLYLGPNFTKDGTVTGNDKVIARGGQVYTGGLGANALTFTGSTQVAVNTSTYAYML